jgi:hypothetical protein
MSLVHIPRPCKRGRKCFVQCLECLEPVERHGDYSDRYARYIADLKESAEARQPAPEEGK